MTSSLNREAFYHGKESLLGMVITGFIAWMFVGEAIVLYEVFRSAVKNGFAWVDVFKIGSTLSLLFLVLIVVKKGGSE